MRNFSRGLTISGNFWRVQSFESNGFRRKIPILHNSFGNTLNQTAPAKSMMTDESKILNPYSLVNTLLLGMPRLVV
jgi:hypothetical protein